MSAPSPTSFFVSPALVASLRNLVDNFGRTAFTGHYKFVTSDPPALMAAWMASQQRLCLTRGHALPLGDAVREVPLHIEVGVASFTLDTSLVQEDVARFIQSVDSEAREHFPGESFGFDGKRPRLSEANSRILNRRRVAEVFKDQDNFFSVGKMSCLDAAIREFDQPALLVPFQKEDGDWCLVLAARLEQHNARRYAPVNNPPLSVN